MSVLRLRVYSSSQVWAGNKLTILRFSTRRHPLTFGSHCENLGSHAHHKTRRSRTVLAKTPRLEGKPRSMVRRGPQGKLENARGNETDLPQRRFGWTQDGVQYSW